MSGVRAGLAACLALGTGCSGPPRYERLARADTVYVRDRRGVDQVLAVVPAGDSVDVRAEVPGKAYLYWRVRLADGREGVMIWDPATFPARPARR